MPTKSQQEVKQDLPFIHRSHSAPWTFVCDIAGCWPFSLGLWRHLSTPHSCLPAQRAEYPKDNWSYYSSIHNVGLGIFSLFTKLLSSVHPLWCYCMLSSSVVPSTSCSPRDFQQLTVLEHVKHTTADSHLTPRALLPPVLNCVGPYNTTACLGLPLCVKGTSEFCAVTFPFLFRMSFQPSNLFVALVSRHRVCGGKATAFRILVFYCWYLKMVCNRQRFWEKKMPQFILPRRIEFHCI